MPWGRGVSKTTVPQGAGVTGFCDGDLLTAEQLSLLQRGDLLVQVMGRATYTDVFGKPHTTVFRRLVGGSIGF